MNRLKDIREARDLTQAQIAEMVGTAPATISRLESGAMQMTEVWARRIAKALNLHLSEVFGEVVPPAYPGMAVLGEVQAGVWCEAEVADALRYPPLPIFPDPLYSSKAQYALRVRGESMNRVVRDGSYIVCVSWAEIGRDPREGDLVVVERRRAGLVETTVKRIKFAGGQMVLAPDSDDPKWQNPIPLGTGSDAEEAAITALVVGKYERFS